MLPSCIWCQGMKKWVSKKNIKILLLQDLEKSLTSTPKSVLCSLYKPMLHWRWNQYIGRTSKVLQKKNNINNFAEPCSPKLKISKNKGCLGNSNMSSLCKNIMIHFLNYMTTCYYFFTGPLPQPVYQMGNAH